MRRVLVDKGRLTLGDDVIGFMEKKVTPYGTGAKVDCIKEYLGHRAYVVICKKAPKSAKRPEK
jgi:putative transposon-encoded protein